MPTKETEREKWKTIRNQRKVAGLCIRCAKPRSAKSTCYCDACLEKNKLSNFKQNQKLKSQGICLWCHKNKSEVKSGYCQSCYNKLLESNKRYQKKHYRRKSKKYIKMLMDLD
jgi:hypothetical protein